MVEGIISSRFGKAEAMYNLGAGQWHPGLRFSDPIFGSSETMVQGYLAKIYGEDTGIQQLCTVGMSMKHQKDIPEK